MNVTTWSENNPEYGLFALARQSRQNLARDIFVRLAAISKYVDAAGKTVQLVDVNIPYNPATGYFVFDITTLPAERSNMLRRCAQMAANIVDAIDPDDVSTAFVWNPVNPSHNDTKAATALAAYSVTQFIDPSHDLANFGDTKVSEMGNRVVFGTELPKLTINEAYAVLANDREDLAKAPMQMPMNNYVIKSHKKRFWVELNNPLGGNGADLSSSEKGAARLQYVQDAYKPGLVMPSDFHVYNLQILEKTNALPPVADDLRNNPANVTGDTGSNLNWKKILDVRDFTNRPMDNAAMPPAAVATMLQDPATGPTPDEQRRNFMVMPTDNFTAPPMNTPGVTTNHRYFTIGNLQRFPGYNGGMASEVNTTTRLADGPNPPTPDPNTGLPLPPNSMEHDTREKYTDAQLTGAMDPKLKQNCVVLRRLANPYLPPNVPGTQDSALPTYDPNLPAFVDTLPANPYITVDVLDNVPTNNGVNYASDKQYMNLPQQPTSIQRRHPYAAATAAPGNNSFFLDNAAPDNMSWLAHFDRHLINSVELLQVAACPPYLLTSDFSSAAASHNEHTAQKMFLGTNVTASGAIVEETKFWYKALDLLTVKPRFNGVPVGGAEPGKINPNTLWESSTSNRVWKAILDKQTNNTFDDAFVDASWKGFQDFKKTRENKTTPVKEDAGRTELEGGTDLPIYQISQAAAPTVANQTRLSILRAPPSGGNPFLFNPTDFSKSP
ncbi:MAG: hypothetical protein ACRCZF_09595, partial [Gemmataceae bacterium]